MGVEAFFLVVAALFGLVFGSFLNVCIVRLPNEDPKARSLVRPPSSCPKCHRAIAWYDNIPVVSWLVLRGKCRGVVRQPHLSPVHHHSRARGQPPVAPCLRPAV